MVLRPYAAAKRTLTVADKLMEVNWGLVLLITLLAVAGFAMLYSVAGGHFRPWALPQIIRFVLGFFVLVVAAVILGGAYMVTRSAALEQAYPGFTQLWVQRAGSAAQKSVLVGVRNMEDKSIDYRIEMTVGGQLVAQWESMALDNDAEWQQVVSLANQQLPPNGNEVIVNLYRSDDPNTVYRHATLYLQ